MNYIIPANPGFQHIVAWPAEIKNHQLGPFDRLDKEPIIAWQIRLDPQLGHPVAEPVTVSGPIWRDRPSAIAYPDGRIYDQTFECWHDDAVKWLDSVNKSYAKERAGQAVIRACG